MKIADKLGLFRAQAHQHLKVAHQQLQEERQSAIRARKAGEIALAAAEKALISQLEHTPGHISPHRARTSRTHSTRARR